MKNKILTIDRASISMNTSTKEESERTMRSGTQDFVDTLAAQGLLPDGPVVVSDGEAIRSPSPFYVPTLPPPPPLPNAIPVVLPTLGRL